MVGPMMLSRRRFLQRVAGGAALPLAACPAWAQAYPARPVRLISGFAAGATVDLFGRLMAAWLSKQLGEPFIVDDRTGAAGNIAAEAVARSPADAYTLLLISVINAINATLYRNLKFSFVEDIVPIASFYREGPAIVVINPAFPARTIPDFIAYARANPGKVVMASAGSGTPQHIYGELFKMMAHVDLLHVPYRSAVQATTDLLDGRVQVIFDPVANSIAHVRSGRLTALAVTSAARLPALPDVPAVGEFVAGYEASGWLGVGAPRKTPTEIVERLNRAINEGLADSTMQSRFADLGYAPFASSSADFAALVVAETEKWSQVVKYSGATAE